jgi:AcrR family transcriptional regulator
MHHDKPTEGTTSENSIHMYTDWMPIVLTPELAAEAGTRIVAESGWEALSLRGVASELSVTPMALYRHVSDSDSLKAAVVQAIIERFIAAKPSGDTRADLADWARSFHQHLTKYPGLSANLLTMWFESPALLERIDDLLVLVHEAGLDGFEEVAVVNAVFMYVLMRCEAERSVRSAGAVRRSLRTASASRPLDRLTTLAKHYTTAEFDAHFEFGLTSLIAGLPLPAPRRKRTR